MNSTLGFNTLLVANRGEIACRIIRGAASLGLQTVAVFSDPDRGAPHVRLADRSVRLGPAAPADSYLRADAIVEAALATGAQAVHPGYGFLSEDAAFARAVETAGLVFVGPTPGQLELFGEKHAARRAAASADVPLLPGSGLLASVEEALGAAEAIGFPVMLKATGGGGGIGIQPCADASQLEAKFDAVRRVAQAGFRTAGIYLERLVSSARHIEVQIVGDGRGEVVVLGDRDCSLQRRHQKVIEEAPAPGLPDHVRATLASSSARLAESVSYRSAGTVEFLYDPGREEAAFLEVNARLQVEHPVTEAVWGADLVAAMLRLAGGDRTVLSELARLQPGGHAVEARIYAEDPAKDYLPSAGLITRASFPDDVRVDTWVESGTEVTTAYDPLLAKVIAVDVDRSCAFARLSDALGAVRLDGIETNLDLLRAAVTAPALVDVTHTTATLSALTPQTTRIDVLRGGTQTTVQDWPGRLGYWHVGVPPSGPMDDRSFRWANRALGNGQGAPALEITLTGPALHFAGPTAICLTGAAAEARLDGQPVAMWAPVTIPAGGVLDIGPVGPPGLRTYLAVAGGFQVPAYLGSASTFVLGGFGGHAGRALRAGDVLRPATPAPAVPAGPAHELGRAALTATQAAGVLKLQSQLGEGIELAVTPGWAARDPQRALDLALELPERVAVADGRRLILFFDEFQELASERRPYGDPDQITQRMRAVFQRSTSVSYLFAGSLEHVMRDLFSPSQRAFSGFGSFHPLRPITSADWRTGLTERFAADDCTIVPAALERLIELGEGHPRATMRIAQQTHLVSVQLGQRAIDLDLVALGFQAALNGDLPTMEQTVEQIRRLHKNALIVARAIAEGHPAPRRLSPAIRDRVLNLLARAGVVEHVARGDWRIVNPLLKEYLRTFYTDHV